MAIQKPQRQYSRICGCHLRYYSYCPRADDCRNKEPRAVLLSPDFRKESAALKEHQNIIRFVSKHNIKTPQDIRDVAAECQVRMGDLKETRDILYNRIRRPKPTDTVEELKAARDSITRDIAEVREQLKTANKLNSHVWKKKSMKSWR